MRSTKTIVVITLLVFSCILFSRCIDNSLGGDDPRGPAYAGTQTCISCHKNIFDSYVHANHYKSTSLIRPGSLSKWADSSVFYFPDSSSIRIIENDSQFYQVHFANDKEIRSEKFDVAFGSGEKAQTYGYWKGDRIYQLPLTYYAGMHVWANSPGFPLRRVYYDRVIEGRCFECHATYIKKEFVQSGALNVDEKMEPSTAIYGIDCERCHGPAASHVEYHQDHPSATKGMYIVSINSLTRQQKLDVCATCHSGNDLVASRPLFAFMPGDTLANFYFPDFEPNKEPDVHGKQMQLLKTSLCFQKSDMTCGSCHNPHEGERGQMQMFISKCMNCHQSDTHAQAMLKGNLENKNCIDCHMPLQQSKVISFSNGAGLNQIPYFLRSHRIAVYKEEKRDVKAKM